MPRASRLVVAALAMGCAHQPEPCPTNAASGVDGKPGKVSGAETVEARRPGQREHDEEVADMVDAVEPARLEADVRALAAFGTRHSLSDTKSDERGIGAAGRFIHRRFEQIAEAGQLKVRFGEFTAPKGPRVPEPWPMKNVIAELPGTATGPAARTIVISGHYDSRASDVMDAQGDAPGANDDASGVAVVLETARVLAPFRFEASILFAAVAGEEQGLLGSEALLAELRQRGVRVEAMLTNDIVGASTSAGGRSDKGRVRVFSAGLPYDPARRDALLAVGGENDGSSRQLARAVAEAAQSYVPGFDAMLVYRLDRYLRGGDHRPFHRAGVPAVRLTEVEENFRRQHQDVRREGGVEYGDVPDQVDAEYMANVARVNVAAVASLARAPVAPREVRIDVRELDEDTTIVWKPSEDAKVRYEVVARPSSLSQWSHAFPAGRDGTVTVPLSKDHFVFGLRAVGPNGHRSLAVFPLPLRESPAAEADGKPPAPKAQSEKPPRE